MCVTPPYNVPSLSPQGPEAANVTGPGGGPVRGSRYAPNRRRFRRFRPPFRQGGGTGAAAPTPPALTPTQGLPQTEGEGGGKVIPPPPPRRRRPPPFFFRRRGGRTRAPEEQEVGHGGGTRGDVGTRGGGGGQRDMAGHRDKMRMGWGDRDGDKRGRKGTWGVTGMGGVPVVTPPSLSSPPPGPRHPGAAAAPRGRPANPHRGPPRAPLPAPLPQVLGGELGGQPPSVTTDFGVQTPPGWGIAPLKGQSPPWWVILGCNPLIFGGPHPPLLPPPRPFRPQPTAPPPAAGDTGGVPGKGGQPEPQRRRNRPFFQRRRQQPPAPQVRNASPKNFGGVP